MKQANLLRKYSTTMYDCLDVCDEAGNHTYKIIGIQDDEESVALKCNENGKLYVCRPECLRVQPLFWCDGKPVYAGDKLKTEKYGIVVAGCFSYINNGVEFVNVLTDIGAGPNIKVSELSFKKTVTRWMNIYPAGVGCHHYDNKEQADFHAADSRIACIEVSWEQ